MLSDADSYCKTSWNPRGGGGGWRTFQTDWGSWCTKADKESQGLLETATYSVDTASFKAQTKLEEAGALTVVLRDVILILEVGPYAPGEVCLGLSPHLK